MSSRDSGHSHYKKVPVQQEGLPLLLALHFIVNGIKKSSLDIQKQTQKLPSSFHFPPVVRL